MGRLQKVIGKLLRIDRAPRKAGQGMRGATITYVYACLQCHGEFKSKRKDSAFCSRLCSHLYYASQPRRRACSVCGSTFYVYLKHRYISSRKTCSPAYSEIQRVRSHDYANPERNAKLSAACIKNNAVAVLHTPAVRKRAGPGISRVKTGVVRTGNSALGTSRRQQWVVLISPWGDTYATMCIRQFVRDHPELFNEEDLRRRKSATRYVTELEGNMTCRAMTGLSEMARGAKNAWKGWTAHKIKPERELDEVLG